MKFGIKTVILGSVLMLLMVSLVMQGYVMYSIRSAQKFVVDSSDKVTTKGVNAAEFWENKQFLFIGPSVISLVAMGLLATMYIMA